MVMVVDTGMLGADLVGVTALLEVQHMKKNSGVEMVFRSLCLATFRVRGELPNDVEEYFGH